MTESTEHKVKRDGWPAGPWDTEPDRVEWRAHGFPCLIVRNNMGALCGYVGLPPGHAFHGADYGTPPVDAHGGLTYANRCAGHICHVPQDGEPADVWWLGFDCNHMGDVAPSMLALRSQPGWPKPAGAWLDTYKTVEYVRAEVERLAAQLKGLEHGSKETSEKTENETQEKNQEKPHDESD